MKRRVYGWLAIAVLALTSNAFSEHSGRNATSTAIWVLSQDKDSLTICVAYSIPFRNLFFVRNTTQGFASTLGLSVDAVDSATGTNFHQFKLNTVIADSYQKSRNPEEIAEDCAMLRIPKSTFVFNVEIRDDLEKITYLNTSLKRRFSKDQSYKFLQPIFLASKTDSSLNPTIVESTAEFPNAVNALIITSDEDSQQLTATILKDKHLVSVAKNIRRITLSATPRIKNSMIEFPFTNQPGNALLFEFPSDTLTEGEYEIHIKWSQGEETFPFSYLWMNKPVSLANFNFALQLVKYIVNDSTYAYLTSGRNQEIKEKFKQFWKQRDPTPKTAYNEAEAEFYRRADYAVNAFPTVTSPNGATTDRGKIYILYGKPEKIERQLRNEGTYEVWIYPVLGRKIIFKEVKPGEFKLYQTEKL